MNPLSSHFTLSACALATSLLLAACGGGDAAGPPDTVAPSVAISDSEATSTATGAVTFAFTFSEDVGTSFTAEDITVVGGTAGALVKVDATHYTMLVTPTANLASTINVSVAAAKFNDLANNPNVAAATAQQAYNTVPVAPPVVAGTVLATFDETTPPVIVEFGGAGYAIESGPAGGSGKSLAITRMGGEVYAGVFVTTTPMAFAANRKTVTARVYSPSAGVPMVAKAEYADNAGTGDTAPTTAVVAGWQTLTWVFNNVDLSKSYTRFTVLPNLGTLGSGQKYYVDDIVLAPAGAAVIDPPAGVDTVLATFDEATPPQIFEFGGAGYAIEAGPAGASGNALRITRSGGEVYAGAYVTTAPMAFSATRKTISARVYSPVAGTPMVVKAEYADNAGTGDTSPTTAVVAGWQTLTWVFNNLDLSKTYTRFTLLPNLGTVGSGQLYYFDDIKLLAAAAAVVVAPKVIATLDEAGAALTGFEGAQDSTLVNDPTGAANKVGRVVKPGSNAPFYAGTTVVTVANGGLPAIAFSASAKTMTARVWSADAGIPVRLKLEDIADGSKSVETEASTTVAGGWQTLTFNFASPAADAPKALDLATAYTKATVFFNFGKTGAQAGGAQTYYFDDLSFVTGTGSNTVLATFDEVTPRLLTGFGGAEDATLVGTSGGLPSGGSGKALKVVRSAGALSYAGTSIQASVNDAVPTIPFAAGATKMSLRVYSAYPAGLRVHLKVEQAGHPEINSEVDAYTTVSNAWETLTFDFGPAGKHFIPNAQGPNGYDLSKPTAQLDVSKVFNKVSIFFDFGLGDAGYAAMPDTRSYFFDDLRFVGP